MEIVSFSYKKGDPPKGYTVLDARVLENPHYDPELRELDGLDPKVQAFVNRSRGFSKLVLPILGLGTPLAHLPQKIAVGCYGGRHRSVAVAEYLARHFRRMGVSVQVTHIQLGKAGSTD